MKQIRKGEKEKRGGGDRTGANLRLWTASLLLWMFLVRGACADSILNSKHNLSVTGPGDIKASAETDACIFCHTPHRSTTEAPLWNRSSSGATYIPYSSSTTKAVIGQPTGASKLCLSCHDGTVALGLVHNRGSLIAMRNNVTTLPSGKSNLSTDLSDDHPVSFTYDSALASAHGELKDPSTLVGAVRLDKNRQLQCTSCHDPHNDQYGKFLVQNNYASSLCMTCHTPSQWNGSSHRTSTARWNGNGANPWPHGSESTVAANACANCHASHNAGEKPRLLNQKGEEQNCYVCHNANVAAKNIEAEFKKLSVHPVETFAGIHDPAEEIINSARHVECADCHNPHASSARAAVPPNASGALAGVKGVSESGTVLGAITKEHELCFRCHADSSDRGQATVTRQFVQTNTRLEFTPANLSYHPVTTPGRNANVPSLLSPYTTSSVIGCTDCHNNNQGPGSGGTGPNGPHGSAFAPLLERRLDTTDFAAESSLAYALCYKCHSRSSILSDQSFKGHYKHVVVEQTACTTCHDSHGVSGVQDLINFNRGYVSPSANGRMEYVKQGIFRGNCSLSCHGSDHNAKGY
jgi:predicted CXXCH cytochrome family protein